MNNEPLWVIKYDDADVPDDVFIGEGAEEAARATYERRLMSWNCHLLCRADVDKMKWIPFVERFEDMSPEGKLRIQRQEDGDVILTVLEGDHVGGLQAIAHVEFCTPMTGGGSSEHTWRAIIALAEAMEKDNETRKQVREQACRPG